MKLYTFYSDSHKEIYEDYFLKSFNDCGLNKSFELDVTRIEQRGIGGWGSEGFNESMIDKVKILQRASQENYGKHFVFSDCDVQFFGDFKEDILGYTSDELDMIAQSDEGAICAGFFIAKGSEKLERFFNLIRHETPKLIGKADDQAAINEHCHQISHALLPTDKYFNISSEWELKRTLIGGHKGWEAGKPCNLPKNMLIHHANWTEGVHNKMKMMSYIRGNI
jgi:hypothetical protein